MRYIDLEKIIDLLAYLEERREFPPDETIDKARKAVDRELKILRARQDRQIEFWQLYPYTKL